MNPGAKVDNIENVVGEGSPFIGKGAKVGNVKNVVWVGRSFENVDDFIAKTKKRKKR
ncbi:hypothetical protein ACFLYU_04490 [Candidatus Dependentiae bacterium]